MTVAEIMAVTGFKNKGTFYKYVVNTSHESKATSGHKWEA